MDSSPIPTRPSSTTRLWLGAVAGAGVLAALAYGVRDGSVYDWDREPIEYFDRHYYDLGAVRMVVEAAVWAGIVVGGLFAVALFVLLMATRAYRCATFWALTVGGALLSTHVLKALVQRPEIGEFDTEYSFPSGNATVSMACVVAVVLLTRSRLRRIVAATGAVVVPVYGVALVLLLWHYPSDVAGGWALGLALVAALRLVLGDVSAPVPGWFRSPPFGPSSPRQR